MQLLCLRFRNGLACLLLLAHASLVLADRAAQHEDTAARLTADLQEHIKAQLRAGEFNSNALSDQLKQSYLRVSVIFGHELLSVHCSCACPRSERDSYPLGLRPPRAINDIIISEKESRFVLRVGTFGEGGV